jgi:ribonuclease VapC
MPVAINRLAGWMPLPRRPLRAIKAAAARSMSAATLVETSIVIGARYGGDGLRALDLFQAKAEIALVPVDAEQAHAARDAFLRHGKGRHPAGSTMGTASPSPLP